MLRHLVLILALAIPLPGAAQSADIRGPVARVTLVELFTSEGCSSCPPAEQWLNRAEARSDLWSRVVPVAFHVDYWDYIGWPDRFAAREHSNRQQTYRDIGRTRAVYTPGFVVGGKEWRGWFRDPTLTLPADVDIGSISVNVRDGRFDARFEPVVEVPESIELHVARLGFDFVTEVRAGENHRPHAEAQIRRARVDPAPHERRRRRRVRGVGRAACGVESVAARGARGVGERSGRPVSDPGRG